MVSPAVRWRESWRRTVTGRSRSPAGVRGQPSASTRSGQHTPQSHGSTLPRLLSTAVAAVKSTAELGWKSTAPVERTTHGETLLRLSESCAAEMRETREWTGVLAGQSRDDDSSRFQQQSQHGRPVLAYVRVPAVLKARIRGGQLKQPSPSRCIPSPVLPFPRDSSCTLSLPHDRCFGIFGRGAPASRRFQQQSCGLQAIRFLPQRWRQSLVRRNAIGEERR